MKKCMNCNAGYRSESWECPVCRKTPRKNNGYVSFLAESVEPDHGFKIDYFAKLADLESKNFWFCSRNRLIMWAFNKYFGHAKNFLEMGCGTGFVLSGIEKSFPQVAIFGSDIYPAGLQYAGRRLKRHNCSR